MRAVSGFREPGEWGPKQPGSQEQDAKKCGEQKKVIQGAWSIGSAIKSCYTVPIILCSLLPKLLSFAPWPFRSHAPCSLNLLTPFDPFHPHGCAFQVLVHIKIQIFQNTELDSNLKVWLWSIFWHCCLGKFCSIIFLANEHLLAYE